MGGGVVDEKGEISSEPPVTVVPTWFQPVSATDYTPTKMCSDSFGCSYPRRGRDESGRFFFYLESAIHLHLRMISSRLSATLLKCFGHFSDPGAGDRSQSPRC